MALSSLALPVRDRRGVDAFAAQDRGALSGLGSVPLPEDAELEPGLARSPLGAGVFLGLLLVAQVTILGDSPVGCEIGRATVCTPVTNAQLVRTLLLDKKHYQIH